MSWASIHRIGRGVHDNIIQDSANDASKDLYQEIDPRRDLDILSEFQIL